MSARELLERHNPVLIILPEDTSRNRPGAVTRGRGRGDYHPCSAELLLSLVIWRARPKPWLLVPLLRLLPRFKEAPIDLAELKLKAEAADPASTAAWELDIEPIRSQNSRQAWSAYRKIRARPELAPYLQPVVYGRLAPGRDGPVLQYWYLYIYNDAPNKHEGDWEMVSIQLNEEEKPVRAGYAGHASGYKREWRDVERDGEEERPIVYVARGSHAAYFAYRKRGYRTNSLPTPRNLPPLIQELVSKAYDLVRRYWPFWDHPPARPDDGSTEEPARGERLDLPNANIIVLPEVAEGAPPPADRWWMRLNGKWGSRHARGFGVIAPDPPWMHDKWRRPSEWIEGCLPDS